MVCTCRSPATQKPAGGRGACCEAPASTGRAAARARQTARATRRRTGRTSPLARRTPVVMSRRAVSLTAALAVVAPLATAARAASHHAGDTVVAHADATGAVLGNGVVSRTWSVAGGAVRTTGLT